MLIVISPHTALCIDDPGTRRIVSTRFSQITAGETYDYDRHGELIVVEVGDTVSQLEAEVGCPILNDYDGACFGEPGFSPVFEAIEEHAACYEVVAILSDDGFGVAMFVPKQPGIDAELLAMCAAHATPAPDLG